MMALWAMSLPGLVTLLFVLALLDQLAVKAGKTKWIPWRGGKRQGQIASTGFEQLHVAFDPGKQHELTQRTSNSLLREEESDGAPPGDSVDLASGTAIIRR